jgi:catechol 2,3-dioxygenase-like lactoylglutathione lyase family enzyme
MGLTAVRVVSVPVADQDRARDFYVERLGFELVADEAMGPDMRWVQVRPPGGEATLTLVTWFETMPAGSLRGMVLDTDDLEAEVARLTAAGVTLDGAPEEAAWGRFVTLSDPDGNGLIVRQPPADG